MSKSLIVTLAVAVAATFAVVDVADAKRLGGGRSSGMQRNMPERTSPTATPATPATPANPSAAPSTVPAQAQAMRPGAAAAAAPAKRSWMAPLAGLAAGLGLAALASHLGFGAELANFMLIALAVVAAVALFAFLRRRSAAAKSPALAGAAAGMGGSGGAAMPAPWSAPQGNDMQRTSLEGSGPAAMPSLGNTAPIAASAAPMAGVFVPAAFDSESFERIAKAIFLRMQAANDSANLDDLRQFTTPETFAEMKADLLDRGHGTQHTDIRSVEAKVLDVVDEGARQVVSVRYRGEAVEQSGAAPAAFDEVWHLVRSTGEERWLIAGIEQMR